MTSYIYISIENDNKQQSMKERKEDFFVVCLRKAKKKIVKNFPSHFFVCLSHCLYLSVRAKQPPAKKNQLIEN